MHIKEHYLVLWTEKLLIIKMTHRHRYEYSVAYRGSRGRTSITTHLHIYSLQSFQYKQFSCREKEKMSIKQTSDSTLDGEHLQE